MPGLPGMKISLQRQINCVGDWRKVTASEVFNTSDCFIVVFKANFTGKLLIVNQGTSGRNTIIFPNRDQKNGMERRVEYSLPHDKGFKFKAPAGTEKIIFLMSTTAIPKATLNSLKLTEDDEGSSAVSVTDSKGKVDKNVEAVEEASDLYVLAKQRRLAKPVIVRLTLKHRQQEKDK